MSKLADCFIDLSNYINDSINSFDMPVAFKKSIVEINKNIIPTSRTL